MDRLDKSMDSQTYSKVLQAYLIAQAASDSKRAALDVIERAEGIPHHLEEHLLQFVDQAFERSRAALSLLIETPAPGLASAAQKLRILIDDSFYNASPMTPVYSLDQPGSFSPEAALSRVLSDLERLAG